MPVGIQGGLRLVGGGGLFQPARQDMRLGVADEQQHRLEVVRDASQRRRVAGRAGPVAGFHVERQLRHAASEELVEQRGPTPEVIRDGAFALRGSQARGRIWRRGGRDDVTGVQGLLHAGDQVGIGHRLLQHPEDLQLGRLGMHGSRKAGAEDHDRQPRVRGILAQGAKHVHRMAVGQHQVGDQQVGATGFKLPPQLGDAGRMGEFDRQLGQRHADEAADHGVVLQHQDAAAPGHKAPAPAGPITARIWCGSSLTMRGLCTIGTPCRANR